MFIELDRHETAEDYAPAPRPPLRRRLRPWAAAVLVAVSLLALGSAAGAPSPALQHVRDIQVQAEAEIVPTRENLLIVEPGKLTAFDPQTARQRWRSETGLREQWVTVEGDLLLVRGVGRTPAAGPSNGTAMAISAQTGEVRWRIPGQLEMAGDFMVSKEISYDPLPAARLTVYNQAAQRIWSADGLATLHAVDARRKVVLTVNPTSGEVVEFNLDNGTITGRSMVPELVGAGGIYTDGTAMTVYFADGSSVTQRGSAFVRSPNESVVEPSQDITAAREEKVDCGMVWCVSSPFRMGVLLVDKTTGETVHNGEFWTSVIRTDFGVIGVTPEFGDVTSYFSVYDSATGRVRKITGWTPIGFRPEARVVTRPGPIYLVAAAPPRTFFAVLDGTGVHVAGSVPHENLLGCVAANGLVVCRVDPQTIEVWHLAV